MQRREETLCAVQWPDLSAVGLLSMYCCEVLDVGSAWSYRDCTWPNASRELVSTLGTAKQ